MSDETIDSDDDDDGGHQRRCETWTALLTMTSFLLISDMFAVQSWQIPDISRVRQTATVDVSASVCIGQIYRTRAMQRDRSHAVHSIFMQDNRIFPLSENPSSSDALLRCFDG